MKWIGLTGGIGTGKSSVAKILRDLGVPVLDADYFSRLAIAPGTDGLNLVTQAFGPDIVNGKGEIDREKLGKIVFSNPEKLKKLESIVHPIVQKLKAQEKLRLENEGQKISFYDVPLLFEKNLQNEFDLTLVVYCSPDEQKKRIKIRDSLSDEEIENRLKAQLPIDEKIKLANYTILNTEAPTVLKSNVEKVLADILST